MKKISAFIILIISILLTSVPIFADKNIDKLLDEVFEYGYNIGKTEGYLDKNRDYPININKIDTVTVEKKYEEYNKDNEIKLKILNSYKAGYVKGYIEGYYLEVLPDNKEGKKEESNYGEAFGLILGEVYGRRDFYKGNKNNWSKAKPTDKTIISIFNLSIETSSYRNEFLNAFKHSFQKSYEESYRKANFEPKKISYEDGLKDGEVFGKLFGENDGRKDYFEGKISNWERNFPTEVKLRSEFGLNSDYNKYEDGFFTGFKKAYEESYKKGFREGNKELNLIKSENGFNDGNDVGLNRGNNFAEIDYYLRKSADISRHYLSNSQIINDYNLYLDNNRYKDGFITGFRDGFAEGYIKRFQELNKEVAIKKEESFLVPSSGGEFEFRDNELKVNVLSGTYYDEIIVKISSLNDDKYRSTTKNIKRISEIFNISIHNKIKEYNKENLIELSFEYHGPDNGGIYKFVNGEWLYMPSIIEEGVIKTFVVPGSIKEEGSDYAVFIDKSAHKIHDIRGHWAKDEINTYLRRKHISAYKDNTFKPNSYMTKGQLLMVLNKVYKWDLPEDVSSVKKYKDYNQFKNYQKVVQYSLNNGYIKADNKNKLNLDSPITYKEVEALMRKVTKSNNFKWSNTSNKILYKKGVRCKSFNSYNNKITRSEAIYMLYLLNEWKN
ncbi:S-layer homology domain-containing protein [Anaerosalibacter sp. Marseille-P3206]|uniref:S-layer homology domain-containing protein n=1 Tax=Anaerosalibacter sp. Marseille-P3206 TaxID=1871005 RepID=UPI00098434C7|nr:S-layer homology domain-containing protein [Anaerosalibacter sp. Marseille-P3206]